MAVKKHRSPEAIAAIWKDLEYKISLIADRDTREAYAAQFASDFHSKFGGIDPKLRLDDWIKKDRARHDATSRPFFGEREGAKYNPPIAHQDIEHEPIVATRFTWRDPATIPPRPWIYGRWLLRHTVTALLAPGGVGKSALVVSTALALASGKPVLGKPIHGPPKSVWYWNLEDDQEELSRQFHAAALLHGIDQDACAQRLFVDSALDGAELCTATDESGDFRIITPIMQSIIDQIKARGIDVLIIDPFVSSHQVDENHNSKIDRIVKFWARVAKEANCSVVLVHHTRKLAGQEVTAEHSRGASAMVNAARSTLVLNRMGQEEAEQFGITDRAEQRRYFSVRDDKANRAPPESQEWYRMASVDLGNGDSVGVPQPWQPTDIFADITPNHLYRCQVAISKGEWRESVQAKQWAGHAIAPVLGLNLDDKRDKAKASRILRTWVQNGALKTVDRPDESRRPRTFIEVGEWTTPDGATLGKNQVEQGGARWSGAASHQRSTQPASPPPPFRGGEGGAGGAGATLDDFDSGADWGGFE